MVSILINKISKIDKKNSFDKVNNLMVKRKETLIMLSILLIITIIMDISIGASWLNLKTLFSTLIKGPYHKSINSAIVWSVRLPMTTTCLFVGASLGMAGNKMQTILKNPLASPYTLGISAAAGFGAAISYVTGFPIPGYSYISVPMSAFLFSLMATMFIFILGKNGRLGIKNMVLFGIVISFFFQALQTLIQFSSTPEVAHEIVFWMFGSLIKASWTGAIITGVIFFISTILIIPMSWKITLLSLGADRAKALGIDSDKLNLKLFFLSSLLTAGAVSFIGTIGFVGLVAPHFAKLLIGEDQRFLIPVSAICGAVVMIIASILSKIIIPGTIIPIGVLTSLVGVPFLLFLILRRRKF